MTKSLSIFVRVQKLLIASSVFCLLTFFISSEAFAKRPPEIRNQEELQIKQDMSGLDLSGNEFVKFDLSGINFSQSNLAGAVFNNSKLVGADLNGADLSDALAYASDFDKADLRDVNFNGALLMESNFQNSDIEGADFTDAVISRIQQKQLCSIADGTNPSTGVETKYSLGC
ncbi:pentapeptide repeat-containing protein [Prochlorococcus sp. MIT 1223]|uniref:pentapeptide repeat-containing protein n=1 Tax=Prochlorococcus sp. MIT 1223 TaxID=3096217 RepID=UPI002A753020|nr:pentapeptide repeat-containing protein [Prochlorococcus sp. MIT 1223]